jgi:hypothetical protein
LEKIFDAWWSLESIQNKILHELWLNIWEREVEGCGLHKKEKWRRLCISLPFFFLETEYEGEGNGRRGAARPWAPAPW